MNIGFGREICGDLDLAASREWLVTNGIGGFASGTVSGMLTRRYHGLLVAALNPPLARTLLLTKLEEIVHYDRQVYALSADRWSDGHVDPQGYRYLEHFSVNDTIPTWRYACGDALLEKRVWMQLGANTTYVQYELVRSSQPLALMLKSFVNYRDYHGITRSLHWQMEVDRVERGVSVVAYEQAVPFFLLSDRAEVITLHDWYYDFFLALERYRGLSDREDHLHVATFHLTLHPGETVTIVASTDPHTSLNGSAALKLRQTYEQRLLSLWKSNRPITAKDAPPWVSRLVLAADQFVVNRSVTRLPLQETMKQAIDWAGSEDAMPEPDVLHGKTIIAGYPWFSDWGRDTMISLPGLTLTTGRSDVARSILRTFASYVSQGMLPNRFPDVGEEPEYNTVDATLWYFEAIHQYYQATQDDDLLAELFPVLAEIIDWHCRGTRYNIHLDPADGLLYAGTSETQLTWMDVKVGNWVVTPRMGKPIEVNALWYNALRTIAKIARQLSKPYQEYDAIADRTLARFDRFWNAELGYCYDVLDTPNGNDASLRPNQIFAVSLPESPLTEAQQRSVVDVCGRSLLTSHGLRSLSPDHPDYREQYGGTPQQRDGAYHQGTVWGWLLGPFVLAHLRVYRNPVQARQFLEPMANHLTAHGIGSLSEIFDGDPPFYPRGCFAQAWTVAEVLRAWAAIEQME